MSTYDYRVKSIPMVSFDTAGLTGTLAALNGTGTTQSLKVLSMYNASDVDVTLSLDGTTDNFIMPAGGTLILDCQTNSDGKGTGRGRWNVPKGQIIYGSGSAGTGLIYTMGWY